MKMPLKRGHIGLIERQVFVLRLCMVSKAKSLPDSRERVWCLEACKCSGFGTSGIASFIASRRNRRLEVDAPLAEPVETSDNS
jgi:hypothetical protein